MKFYAHTADDAAGNRLPEEHGQPLAEHSRRVGEIAHSSIVLLCLAAKGKPSNLLLDLLCP